MSPEQYALAMVRAMELRNAFPQMQAPQVVTQAPLQTPNANSGIQANHPLVSLYRERMNKGKASLSGDEIRRFTGKEKGRDEITFGDRLICYEKILLLTGKATQDEIDSCKGETSQEEIETGNDELPSDEMPELPDGVY